GFRISYFVLQKYGEVQKSTKKYEEVSRSTEKYQEVQKYAFSPLCLMTPSSSINTTTKTASSRVLPEINFQFRLPDSPVKSPTPSHSPSFKKLSQSFPSTEHDPLLKKYNPKLESMRSIKSKDYFDPPKPDTIDFDDVEACEDAEKQARIIREKLLNVKKGINEKQANRDSLGYRTMDHLIPQWWNMTKAEITDILLKQICFVDRGPGISTSIAHFIPHIIDRLKRPDIRQLHILHRLDKQSTGVLILA
ncbi:unnamed protein product, partial [Didymodactylos carnosus]